MSKQSIELEREGVRGFLSNQEIGTDALNALSSIDGVEDLEIVWETENKVQLLYNYIGKEKFWETAEVLAQHGLKRIDI